MTLLIPSYIWLALIASVLHAFSFTYTKQFLAHSTNRLKLAFYSQFAVGLICVFFLPFIDLNNVWEYIWFIIFMCSFVLLGQTCYMNALQYGDASFVVPMLGCKMFAVAVLSVLLFDITYDWVVYAGAVGALVSLFLLNDGKLHGSPKALTYILLTCVFFACADMMVVYLLNQGMSGLEVAICAFLVPTVFFMPFSGVLFRGDWQVSMPFTKTLGIYAVVQLIGIIILMVAFKQAGEATIINIVQSSRGLIAIVVVYLMARFGFSHIEKLSGQQLKSRFFGGLLMFASLTAAVLAV